MQADKSPSEMPPGFNLNQQHLEKVADEAFWATALADEIDVPKIMALLDEILTAQQRILLILFDLAGLNPKKK